MLSESTDELLFLSVKEDDPYAFRILVDKYCDPLLRHCTAYVKRRDVAEEIVSDVFMALWAKKHTINITTSVKAYLYNTTRNHSIDYLRSQTKNPVIENIDDAPHLDNTIANGARFELIDSSVDYSVQLEDLLAKLPPRRRKIFILYRDGMKHKEIAAMLHLSEKTVRNHIDKAVKQLKDAAVNHGLSPLILLLLIS